MSSASRKRSTSLEKHFPKWRRVDPMEGEGEEVPMAECPRCFKKIKMNRGSLSGVRAHEKSCTVREAETEAEFERVSKQKGARTFSPETLIELVVEAGLPLNVVENSAFQKFVKSLCVSFVMPSRRSLAREIKKKVQHHSQAITDELSSIPDIGITCDVWSRSSRSSFVGIVAHFYSDAEGLGRRLIDFVDLKGRHTGANIASCIYTSLEAAGCLGKIRSITTDSASSNFRAMDLLRTEYGMGETGFVHLTCLAHKLHLSIVNTLGFWATASTSDEFSDSGEEDAGDNALTSTAGLEAPQCEQQELLDLLRDEQFLAGDDDDGSEASADIDDSYDEAWGEDVDRSTNRSTKGIGSLLKKLRNHSRFIRQSNIAFDLLHQSVEESLPDGHRFRIIPRDVVVRWNSTHKLLSWFSTYREGFAKYQRQCLARRGSDKLRLYMKANALSPSDEELIDTLQDLLAPFEQATRKFSGSTFTTISSVRAVTRGLSRKLKTGASGHSKVSKFRRALVSSVEKYFKHALVVDNEDDIVGHIYVAASFLDPRYTTTESTVDGKRSIEAVVEYFGIDDCRAQQVTELSQATNEDSDDLLSGLQRRSLSTSDENPTTLSKELQVYADKLRCLRRRCDFVEYWRAPETSDIPILRTVAMLLSCMQASSVSSEEAFSLAGSLSRVRRSRLAGDSLRALMLLRNR